jgi:hypothetical protein
MAPPLSRIRFAMRVGGEVSGPNALLGAWTYFDTAIGCIEDWSGILSEGPVAGDIIEQDWVSGAFWQEGPKKTYSFDVPFTALVTDTVNPNIWESYLAGIDVLKAFRGPLLTLRREFFSKTGARVRREQAAGVLVTDLAVKVGIGRVISTVAVFQQLSGAWAPVSTA